MAEPLPRTSPDVVSRHLGDEVVLVNLVTNEIYALNETGAAFWELFSEGLSRPEIEQRLLASFDVDEATLRNEIDALLAALLERDIVRPT